MHPETAMHPETRYEVVADPLSGERFAVEIQLGGESGEVWYVAGPLHQTDPDDEESLRDWLDNADRDEAAADGAWLLEAYRSGSHC